MIKDFYNCPLDKLFIIQHKLHSSIDIIHSSIYTVVNQTDENLYVVEIGSHIDSQQMIIKKDMVIYIIEFRELEGEIVRHYKKLLIKESTATDKLNDKLRKLKEENDKLRLQLLERNLSKLNINVKDSNGNFRSIYDVLSDLFNVLCDLDCEDDSFNRTLEDISELIAGK